MSLTYRYVYNDGKYIIPIHISDLQRYHWSQVTHIGLKLYLFFDILNNAIMMFEINVLYSAKTSYASRNSCHKQLMDDVHRKAVVYVKDIRDCNYFRKGYKPQCTSCGANRNGSLMLKIFCLIHLQFIRVPNLTEVRFTNKIQWKHYQCVRFSEIQAIHNLVGTKRYTRIALLISTSQNRFCSSALYKTIRICNIEILFRDNYH